MKKRLFLSLQLLLVLVGCEDNSDVPVYHNIADNYRIVCPEPPIRIMSSKDEGEEELGTSLLNYFNIVQVSENLYYMYYESFWGNIAEGKAHVRFAYSEDCIHWNKQLPNRNDQNNIIIPSYYFMSGISVMMVPNSQFPFRLFGLMPVDGNYGIYMWKSQDGYNFSDPKLVLSGYYDTQIVGLLRGDIIKMYVRSRKNCGTNRKIGVAYVDVEGNCINPPMVLKDNYVYNSGASILNDKYDLLFPTFFNNSRDNDEQYVKALIVSGYDSKEIECNIGDWIDDDELSVYVSPGILDINGEKYISYCTRSWSHDSPMPDDGVSNYKLIKIIVHKQ